MKGLKLYFICFLIIYAAVMIFTFSSCSTVKYLPSPTITTKDSVVYKDRVITINVPPVSIPGDTVKLTDTVPCPDAVWRGTATSKSGRTSVKASLANGHLTIDCKTDSLLKQIDSLQAVIKEKETFHSKETVLPPVVQHDKYIPWWVWLIVGVSVLIALLALLKR